MPSSPKGASAPQATALDTYRPRGGDNVRVAAATAFASHSGSLPHDKQYRTTVELYARMCGTDPGGYVAEGPGISVYALSAGTVYRTYVTATRGVEPVIAYYALLDRTPKGRQESATEPLWIRRHDEYEQTLSPAARA